MGRTALKKIYPLVGPGQKTDKKVIFGLPKAEKNWARSQAEKFCPKIEPKFCAQSPLFQTKMSGLFGPKSGRAKKID